MRTGWLAANVGAVGVVLMSVSNVGAGEALASSGALLQELPSGPTAVPAPTTPAAAQPGAHRTRLRFELSGGLSLGTGAHSFTDEWKFSTSKTTSSSSYYYTYTHVATEDYSTSAAYGGSSSPVGFHVGGDLWFAKGLGVGVEILGQSRELHVEPKATTSSGYTDTQKYSSGSYNYTYTYSRMEVRNYANEGLVNGLDHRDTTFNGFVKWSYALSPAVNLELSGGPSLFKIRQRVVRTIGVKAVSSSGCAQRTSSVGSTYTYDLICVLPLAVETVDASSAGFNIGAGLSFKVREGVSIVGQVRYARGGRVTIGGLEPFIEKDPLTSAAVAQTPTTLKIDTGGFSPTVAVRVGF
jgi:opacity protein-like surface antigen